MDLCQLTKWQLRQELVLVHTAPSLPSLLRTTGLIRLKKGATGVVALLLQYWSPPQNMMKCLGHTRACITYHEKSKNIKFSSSKCPNHKRARRRATRWAEKSVLQAKNFKMTKISPNLLKFGVKTLHHVSCPANEASAKIQSLSSLFRRFSVLLVHAVQWWKSLSCS